MVDTVRLGQDLRLLDDLRQQAGRSRGSDLATRTTDTVGRDLDVVTGPDNICQALLLRLLTPAGELAGLGHPDYGSRLYELIGERDTPATRGRAKVFALLALGDEPRVRRVVSLDVGGDGRGSITLRAVLDIDGGAPLNLVVPLSLTGSPVAPPALGGA
jgi:phage baseplate assembly protein W